MLRQEPSERLSAEQILKHPWLQQSSQQSFVSLCNKYEDQTVPDILVQNYEEDLFS